MDINKTMSDETILQELGSRITRHRIDLQLTQADLAVESGLSKRTVERVEAGASTQVSSVIRILRVLDLLDGLNSLIPEAVPRPLELLKLKGKERQRASSKRRGKPSTGKWSWKDDQ
jgi:transcriptional regulator with XRE-family HTH domain